MMRRVAGLLRVALMAAVLAGGAAHAAITCSVATTDVSVVYSPTVATENLTTGTTTVTCNRLLTDPATYAYTLAASNGLQPAGAQNRVQLGASTNRYNYELYRLSPYTNANRWQTAGGNRFAGTIDFGTGTSASISHSFTLRVPGSQTVVPAGTYTDSVTTTLRDSGGVTIHTGSFNVSVITTNSCQFVTPPAAMTFNYTSFQVAAATSSTSFIARCTTGLPYTMALDVTSGSLLGLNYTLSLPVSGSTGTGITQTFLINGDIAGGQAGTCGTATCTGSQTRTVTITF